MNVKLIAEIGAHHLGDVDRGKMLINLASESGADYAKFQKRNPIESVPDDIKYKPHPNPRFAYGDTYLEHRENLELTAAEHQDLKRHCEKKNIGYSTSVWDVTSAREIIQLKPDFVKIPSACNHHFQMLDILFNDYDGGIHISTGMTTRSEMIELVDYVSKMDKDHRVVMYHSTSEYPCPHEHLYLKDILRIKYDFKPRSVGFSNHGYGIAMDPVAVALGAEWIERHFVDDRTLPHTDAAASLEPHGLRSLARDLKAVSLALKCNDGLSEAELQQREKLRYRKK